MVGFHSATALIPPGTNLAWLPQREQLQLSQALLATETHTWPSEQILGSTPNYWSTSSETV